MSTQHHREPIKHTCPDIDRYIKNIKFEIIKDSELKHMDERELFDAASAMSSELQNCIDYLENLRDSNHELRMWGIAEAEMVDALEQKVDEIESKEREENKITSNILPRDMQNDIMISNHVTVNNISR